MDLGSGNVRFEYKWDSSTGNLADLSTCLIGEKVDYAGGNPYDPADPPFDNTWHLPNPTELNWPVAWVTAGFAYDQQLHAGFSKPYINKSFIGVQQFRYRTPSMPANQWVILLGPIDIVREVYQASNGFWYYIITKSSVTSTPLLLPGQ